MAKRVPEIVSEIVPEIVFKIVPETVPEIVPEIVPKIAPQIGDARSPYIMIGQPVIQNTPYIKKHTV